MPSVEFPTGAYVRRFVTEMVNEILSKIKNNHIDMVRRICSNYEKYKGRKVLSLLHWLLSKIKITNSHRVRCHLRQPHSAMRKR